MIVARTRIVLYNQCLQAQNQLAPAIQKSIRMHSKNPRIGLIVAIFVAALAGGAAWWYLRRTPGQQTASSPYADPMLCAQCHGDIAATYAKTGMGRSFRRVRTEKDIDWPASA